MILHVPFIFIPICIHILHLPSICMQVPFILHSCPFMSFLKLWTWLYGLASGPSAINGYR